MYNGRSANLITSREGAQVESVDLLRDGVVSRGVLLDIAALKERSLEAVRGSPALGVPAHDRAAPAPAHHGLAGEPDRAVLSGRPTD